MGSFQRPFQYKKLLLPTKIFAGLVICVLATSLFSFSRAVNFIFFHIRILHCTVVLVCMKKMMIIL